MKQGPTIGRVVLYTLVDTEADINGSRQFPAIVVKVWSPDCVNLRVFADDDKPPLHRTSVCERGPHNEQYGGYWEWPVRIPT